MAPGPTDVFGCVPGEVNCGDRPGPDFDFGASPVLATLPNGRELIVAGQKSGVAYALDPDRQGQQVWRYRAGGGSGLGGIQWGLAVDAERAYIPVAEIYSAAPGGLHAVDLATGKRAWYAAPPRAGVRKAESRLQQRAVFRRHRDPGRRLLAVERRYASAPIRRQTARSCGRSTPIARSRPLNGVRAKGGSMNGPGPTVAGGMVYVSSGYGAFGLRPGNVLLAFAAE